VEKRFHKTETPTEVSKKQKVSKNKQVCPDCGVQFGRFWSHDLHKNSCLGPLRLKCVDPENPLGCLKCGRSFKGDSGIRVHISHCVKTVAKRPEHTDKKCPTSDRVFKYAKSLESHQKQCRESNPSKVSKARKHCRSKEDAAVTRKVQPKKKCNKKNISELGRGKKARHACKTHDFNSNSTSEPSHHIESTSNEDVGQSEDEATGRTELESSSDNQNADIASVESSESAASDDDIIFIQEVRKPSVDEDENQEVYTLPSSPEEGGQDLQTRAIEYSCCFCDFSCQSQQAVRTHMADQHVLL